MLDGLQEVEFGGAEFFLGSSTYASLSKKTLVAAYTDNGKSVLIEIDPTSNTWKDLDLPLQSITFDALARLSDTSFLALGSTAFSPKALYRVDLAPQVLLQKLRSSSEEDFDESVFSKPEHIYCLPADGNRETGVHGFFFPPHNRAYQAPEGTKPPLIILSHGGPTGHHSPGLALTSQYWTSRGFALFLLNYRGSSGHGRKYREALNTNWGLFEPEDAVNAADFLGRYGRIDRTRVGIQGGSAGGYCVCQAITIYPKAFAAAVSLYGISDLSGLIATTHKFEAGYPEMLLFKPGQSQSERDAIVKDRSALTHVDKIETPLLMLHGREDKVVPLEQAELIRDAMEKRGREVRLVVFDGESHGFRKPENLVTTLDEEMAWWRKTLVG
jgi:dipeptidyl aminopeptidase/acylaminoacyl peptidase